MTPTRFLAGQGRSVMTGTVGTAPSVDLLEDHLAEQTLLGPGRCWEGRSATIATMKCRAENGGRPATGSTRPDTGRRREMVRGAMEMSPITLGYLPFGLLLGAAVARSAQPWAAWSATDLIYGGSAHLTVIEMLRTGSGLWAAAGAALLVNVRLLVYSSSLIPLWGSAGVVARLLAAATIIDPTWMLASRSAGQDGTVAQRRAHFTGAAIVLTVGWTAAVTAGAALGSFETLTAVLAVAVPLCLVAIVAPHVRMKGGVAAIAVAAAVTLATTSWPAGSGMLLAMAAAATGGALTPGRSSSRPGSLCWSWDWVVIRFGWPRS
jgi:predicted branched-subunit amino acid permease